MSHHKCHSPQEIICKQNPTSLGYTTYPTKKPVPETVSGRAIIPFSSGPVPVELATALGSEVASVTAIVGFGSTAPVASILGAPIILTPPGTLGTEAFITPVPITITDITAQFNVLVGLDLTLPANISILVQLYAAPLRSTTFNPISPILVLTPALTLPLSIGDVAAGALHGLNIPVPADIQLVLAVGTRSTGLTFIAIVTGAFHAGVAYRIAP